jgi:hypothetical protein
MMSSTRVRVQPGGGGGGDGGTREWSKTRPALGLILGSYVSGMLLWNASADVQSHI